MKSESMSANSSGPAVSCCSVYSTGAVRLPLARSCPCRTQMHMKISTRARQNEHPAQHKLLKFR